MAGGGLYEEAAGLVRAVLKWMRLPESGARIDPLFTKYDC